MRKTSIVGALAMSAMAFQGVKIGVKMKCLDNCSNCIKDNGKDICKIAADDGIVKKIEPGDEVPDICRKKGYFKEKKYQVVGGLF